MGYTNPLVRAQGSLDLTSTLRRRSVAPRIYIKAPNMAPLINIVMGQRRVVEGSREFEQFEQDIDPQTVIAGAVDADAKTVGLTDAAQVHIEAGMTVRKSRTVAAHVTVVTRTEGAASMTLTSVTGIAQADTLVLGAHTREENSDEPQAVNRRPTAVTNLLGTYRDAWGNSAWVETEDYFGEEPVQWRDREQALLMHKIKLNNEMFVSLYRKGGSLNSRTIHNPRGLIQQIANVDAFDNGIVTWPKMEQMAQDMTRLMQSAEPYFFCGRAVRGLINIVAYEKHVPITVERKFGVSVGRLLVGDKTLQLVTVDCLTGGLGTIGIGLDPTALTVKSAKDQRTKKLRWMIETMRGMDITGKDGSTGCVTTDAAPHLENVDGAFVWEDMITAG